jgi:hypothetical protein
MTEEKSIVMAKGKKSLLKDDGNMPNSIVMDWAHAVIFIYFLFCEGMNVVK